MSSTRRGSVICGHNFKRPESTIPIVDVGDFLVADRYKTRPFLLGAARALFTPASIAHPTMGRSAETTCGTAEAQALYVDARDWPLSHENRHMLQRALDQLASWKEMNLPYGDDWSAAISWINFLHSVRPALPVPPCASAYSVQTWLPYFATKDPKLHNRALHTLRVLCRGSEILPIPLLVT
jgi:hypothetical protein